MRKFIISQNIDRYRRLLRSETTEAKRQMLERLLAEEEDERARLGSDDEPEKPIRKFDG